MNLDRFYPGTLCVVLLVLAGSLLGPGPVRAGEAPAAPGPGDRVRVLVFDDRAVTGRLREIESGALVVDSEPDGARRVLARESIAVLEVEHAKKKTGLGAALGFVAGGVAGLLAFAAFADEDAEQRPEPANAFIAGALVGTAAGALIGKNSSTTGWREAPLP